MDERQWYEVYGAVVVVDEQPGGKVTYNWIKWDGSMTPVTDMEEFHNNYTPITEDEANAIFEKQKARSK